MNIKSKSELIELITNYGVDTQAIKSNKGVNLYATIVKDNVLNNYFRLKWGHVSDSEGVYHLWFDDKAELVYLNQSKWEDGWHTIDEINQIDISETAKRKGTDMSELNFGNIETNVIDFKNDDAEVEASLDQTFIETLKEIQKGNSTLFFSLSQEDIFVYEGLIKATLSNDKEETYESVTSEDILKANLIIDDNILIDDNYIISRMREVAQSEVGLNFVVIDHLYSSRYEDGLITNYLRIKQIHSRIEKEAKLLGLQVKVLISTEISGVNLIDVTELNVVKQID